MRRCTAPLFALAFLLLAVAGCRPAPRFTVVGYHVWWMGDAWQEADLAGLDVLAFFDLSVGPDGSIAAANGWPEAWRPMTAAAQRAGARVVPTLSLFDRATFVAVLSDEAATARLLRAAVEAARDGGADGVHLDFEVFEPVPSEVRDAYPRFVRDLRGALRDALGREPVVSVFTLAEDAADAYDERALAAAADHLVVQGYDFHWLTGPTAGPTAALRNPEGLSWEGVLDRYDRLRVPRQKLVMAAPLYGYEWPTEHGEIGAATRGAGEIIAYAPVRERVPEVPVAAAERSARHGLRRDPTTGAPFYAFRDSAGWRQGWFDDAESTRAKLAFVREERLGGVAIFPLGYDGGAFAGLLREAFPDSLREQRAEGSEQ